MLKIFSANIHGPLRNIPEAHVHETLLILKK